MKDAPVRLILEKGYEAVTVQDIIDRADVGRSTFYAHFVDKDELRLEFFRNPGVPTPDVAALRVKGVPCAWSLQMFQHFDAAKRTYRVLVGRQSGARIHDELDRVLDRLAREELQFQMAWRGDPKRVGLVTRFLVSAFIGLLTWWLEENVAPTEVDKLFRTLVLPGVAVVLDEPSFNRAQKPLRKENTVRWSITAKRIAAHKGSGPGRRCSACWSRSQASRRRAGDR